MDEQLLSHEHDYTNYDRFTTVGGSDMYATGIYDKILLVSREKIEQNPSLLT